VSAGHSLQPERAAPKSDLELAAPDYVLVQPGRVYFENEKDIGAIETTFDIVQSSEYRGAVAARVYRSRQSLAALQFRTHFK
jgi:hypothetical protein